jgi:hypothetical protein
MMVIMAVGTTIMTGPLINQIPFIAANGRRHAA